MNKKDMTYMMETAMHNLPNRSLLQTAVAACLCLGMTSFAFAAEDAAKTNAPAKTAVNAGTVKNDPAKISDPANDFAAKEKVTREENDLDAIQARDRGRNYFRDGQYQKAIEDFLKAKRIWEGQQQSLPNVSFARDIESMRKEIADAYYFWAKELYYAAEESAGVGKIDEAIAKCKQAKEMYPACESLMNESITKFEKKRREQEFNQKTSMDEFEPTYKDQRNDNELRLQQGKSLYKIGRLDEAKAKFEQVLASDPYNSIAIDYLRRIYLKMISIGKQRRSLAVSEAIDEASWKPVAPILLSAATEAGDEVTVAPVAKKDVTKSLKNKLDSIKIKSLVYEDTPLDEVVKNLRRLSRELDEDKEGVNFVLRFDEKSADEAAGEGEGGGNKAAAAEEGEEGGEENAEEGGEEKAAAAEGEEEGGEDESVGNMPKISIYFGDENAADGDEENGKSQPISLRQVIEAVCRSADLKFRVEEYAVVIAAKNVPLEDYVTEFYTVEKEAIEAGASSTDAEDLKKYFQDRGVTFDEGAHAIYDEQTNKVIVTNTPEAQVKIERIINQLNTQDPQIQLQVKFVEIEMNDLEELGFEYLVGRPTTYNFADLPMTQLAAGATYDASSGITYYSIDGNGTITSSSTTWGKTDMVVAQGYTTVNSEKSITINNTVSTPRGIEIGYYDQESLQAMADAGMISPTRTNTYFSSDTTNVYAGHSFTTPKEGTYYAAVMPSGRSVTFGYNDTGLVRSAGSNPAAFGEDATAKIQDNVFNWTY